VLSDPRALIAADEWSLTDDNS